MVEAYRSRPERRSKKDLFVIFIILLFVSVAIYGVYKFWGKVPTITEEAKKAHYNYEVTPLINKDYLPTVDKELKNAKKSIRMLMLVVKRGRDAEDPVNILLQDLIKAHKRGITVEVILEKGKTNLDAFNTLRASGINVKSGSLFVIHDKFIIIDDVTVIVGAHNWTYSALMLNNETSVLIKSNPPDPSFIKYFERVKKQAGSRATEEDTRKIQKRLTE